MNHDDDPRYQITWLVRRLFRELSALADEYLADSGLTAADRAILEFLYPACERTVPELAAIYRVSRQHIQTTVNRLLDAGLVEARPNPRHKRSPLYALRAAGRDTFAEIRRNEVELVEELFAGLSESQLDVTRNTLAALRDRLD